MAVAALVTGIVGAACGLIPLLAFPALVLGLVALVLGLIAARNQKRAGFKRPLARSGWLLGVAAVALGIIGFAIVNSAVNDLQHDLDCLGSTPAANCPAN
jgi:hypothetical protein